MADEDTTNPGPDWVPRARLNEMANEMKEMKALLAEERRVREELQDADKPHLERVTKEKEKLAKDLEAARAELEGERTQRQRDQRSAWLSSAAAKHNFHDPDLAARMANLDDIEDPKTAERYVKELAKEKSFLVKDEPKQSPLQRVATGNEQDFQPGQQPQMVTAEELQRQWGAEVLKGLDPNAVPAGE